MTVAVHIILPIKQPPAWERGALQVPGVKGEDGKDLGQRGKRFLLRVGVHGERVACCRWGWGQGLYLVRISFLSSFVRALRSLLVYFFRRQRRSTFSMRKALVCGPEGGGDENGWVSRRGTVAAKVGS